MDIQPVRPKPGPPSRGERKPVYSRVPEEQQAVYIRRAKELGIPLGSWVAKILAEHEGLEVPDFVVKEIDKAARERAREEFDFPKSA